MILDRRLAVLGLKMACEANPSPEDWPTHGAWVCESCSAGGDWLAMRKAPSSAHLRFVGFLSHGPQWWLCYAMLGVVLGKRLPSLVVDVQVFEGLFEAVFEPFLLNNLDEWCTTFCMKSTLLIKNDFIFLVFFFNSLHLLPWENWKKLPTWSKFSLANNWWEAFYSKAKLEF